MITHRLRTERGRHAICVLDASTRSQPPSGPNLNLPVPFSLGYRSPSHSIFFPPGASRSIRISLSETGYPSTHPTTSPTSHILLPLSVYCWAVPSTPSLTMYYYPNLLSTAIDPLVHVYFFDPVTDEIRYEAMRSPGAMPSNSPRLQYVPSQRKPLTLGTDTRGFIQDPVVRGDHAVYFIAAPPSRWEPLSGKQRKDKIRRAKIHVRQIELKTLEQEAALINATHHEPNDDLDDDE